MNAVVQVTPVASADRVEPENVTAVTGVAAPIVTFAGLAGVVSALVRTVKLEPVSVPAGGLVTPAIVSVPTPLFASAHEAPVSVIVTVGPLLEPDVSLATAVAAHDE